MGAFPNDGALLRLGVTILMDINEEWLTGRKYLSMRSECGYGARNFTENSARYMR